MAKQQPDLGKDLFHLDLVDFRIVHGGEGNLAGFQIEEVFDSGTVPEGRGRFI